MLQMCNFFSHSDFKMFVIPGFCERECVPAYVQYTITDWICIFLVLLCFFVLFNLF